MLACAKAVEEAGEQALPAEVQAHVNEELCEWTGKTSELSLAWSEDAISRFDKATESAARLAILTALSPDKIEAEAISAIGSIFQKTPSCWGL